MKRQKSVTLEHFAIFREVRQRDRESVSTAARTVAELYQDLRRLHDLPLPIEALRVAINDEFAPWEYELQDGDRVAFIAPVAGG